MITSLGLSGPALDFARCDQDRWRFEFANLVAVDAETIAANYRIGRRYRWEIGGASYRVALRHLFRISNLARRRGQLSARQGGGRERPSIVVS